MNNSPVFVVGSARSGTSFLYSLLLASGDFAIYEAETHLLRTCPAKYGSLVNDKNWHNFLKDWLQSKQFKRSRLDERQFSLNAEKHRESYSEFLDFFMGEICKSQGKIRWAENTPSHIHVMPEIAASFPDAKFIHIIRDGRAVASSLIKLGWVSSKRSKKSQLITAGLAWEKCVLRGMNAGKKLTGRYLEIRFEDLILSPQPTLENIEKFLSISLDIDKLEHTTVGVIGKQNTAFGKDEKRRKELFNKGSVSRWKDVLPEDDRKILDASLYHTLKSLGYDCKQGKQLSLMLYKNFYKWVMLCKELLKYKLGMGKFLASGLESE